MSKKRRATLEELLEFANAVRDAGGGNPIDALMPSVPQDSSQCLIAKNLNFNCRVDSAHVYGRNYWIMWLDSRATRDVIAEKLNKLKVNHTNEYDDEVEYGVVLPDHIGHCARDFDRAMDHIYTSIHGSYGKQAFQNLENNDRKLIVEMLPYIDEAEKEAYELATQINPDGSIVV